MACRARGIAPRTRSECHSLRTDAHSRPRTAISFATPSTSVPTRGMVAVCRTVGTRYRLPFALPCASLRDHRGDVLPGHLSTRGAQERTRGSYESYQYMYEQQQLYCVPGCYVRGSPRWCEPSSPSADCSRAAGARGRLLQEQRKGIVERSSASTWRLPRWTIWRLPSWRSARGHAASKTCVVARNARSIYRGEDAARCTRTWSLPSDRRSRRAA